MLGGGLELCDLGSEFGGLLLELLLLLGIGSLELLVDIVLGFLCLFHLILG